MAVGCGDELAVGTAVGLGTPGVPAGSTVVAAQAAIVKTAARAAARMVLDTMFAPLAGLGPMGIRW